MYPACSPHALSVLADEGQAVTHTDPAAFLERRSKPQRQYAYTTRHADAIAGLLDRLGLKRLRTPAPRYKPNPHTVGTMLRQALNELQSELPAAISPSIQPEDDRFALETIDRQRNPENPTSAARKTAAGIAWERVLTALAYHLATEHDKLHLIAERWKPKDVRLDLDLILADDTKGTVWILVIAYRKRQLENPVQPTEHRNILRATIQRLPDLLLAK